KAFFTLLENDLLGTHQLLLPVESKKENGNGNCAQENSDSKFNPGPCGGRLRCTSFFFARLVKAM
ncbi:MAG TPA: hypothetical protein VN833_32320, partial [Candidatus Acidoferrales bacterium]|nr:hypothetical protein [Candidatus Acidoferrales bacterium]